MGVLGRLLNSRKFAVILLVSLLGLLSLSAFLPSEITVSAEKWAEIKRTRPFVFWLSERFSTPRIVRNTAFITITAFLFLSTFICTATRISGWWRTRRLEFDKEKSFSFTLEEVSGRPAGLLKEELARSLQAKGWEFSMSGENDKITGAAQKGLRAGFWGSIVFHLSLIVCFIASPVTALTVFRGKLVLTEGITVPLKEGFEAHEGKPLESLPALDITVNDLRGEYAEGIYKLQFGGKLNIKGRYFQKDSPFSVNEPVDVMGYQFALNEFGRSPLVVIEKGGAEVFNYYLNLRHSSEGDYFDLPDGNKLFVLLFPDFIREGNKIGTRSKEPKNPVLLLKVFEGEKELAKGLVRPGERVDVGPYSVGFPELRNWAGIIVVREAGLPVLMAGMAVGLAGLLVRFLSNERRLEFELAGAESGTKIAIKGYSRYYPAFLEREVKEMAGRLKG